MEYRDQTLVLTDDDCVRIIIKDIIQCNPDKAKLYCTNVAVIGWFLGQTMIETKGQYDGKQVFNIVKEEIDAVHKAGTPG